VALVAFVALAGGVACSTGVSSPLAGPAAASRPGRVATGAGSGGAAPPSSVAQGLSRTQLAGQRIVYAYSGLRPPSQLLALIRAGEAAGVIMFGPNISSSEQLKGVADELQRANAASPVRAPLLLMVDQEGGLVRRLPGAPSLSEQGIAASPDGLSLATAAGAGAGRNLAAAGMNVNLAPVLDVARSPSGFDGQYQRSYGASPSWDARLGEAFILALQKTGVAAAAKHFPGLGAASRAQNTDLGPVTLNLTSHTLRTIDEASFQAAIKAGAKLVMLSWAVYPALDPKLPAGLSKSVIGRELRGRLGFRGVTITDSLSAGALRGFGGVGERGVLAAGAGADLLVCAAPHPDENTPKEGVTVMEALAAALARQPSLRSGAEQAVDRVIALRRGS
jgi:beta-N-acetylhexosaminidase